MNIQKQMVEFISFFPSSRAKQAPEMFIHYIHMCCGNLPMTRQRSKTPSAPSQRQPVVRGTVGDERWVAAKAVASPFLPKQLTKNRQKSCREKTKEHNSRKNKGKTKEKNNECSTKKRKRRNQKGKNKKKQHTNLQKWIRTKTKSKKKEKTK